MVHLGRVKPFVSDVSLLYLLSTGRKKSGADYERLDQDGKCLELMCYSLDQDGKCLELICYSLDQGGKCLELICYSLDQDGKCLELIC